jgi:hypothetical protein
MIGSADGTVVKVDVAESRHRTAFKALCSLCIQSDYRCVQPIVLSPALW